MTIRSNSFYALLITISFTLFSFDYNFGSNITTNRLGYILIILVTLLDSIKKPVVNKSWLNNLIIYMPIILMLLMIDAINSSSIGFSSGLILSFFIGFLVFRLFANNFTLFHIFLKNCVLLGLVLTIVLLVLLIKIGFIPEGRALRTFVDSFPGGLNKIMNAICLIIFVSYTSFYFLVRNEILSIKIKFIVMLIISLCFYFVLFTFSRQAIVFIILFYISCLVNLFKLNKIFSIFLPMFFIFSMLFLFNLYSDELVLAKEIIERSELQIKNSEGSASSRLDNYSLAKSIFFENPFGVGNDNFLRQLGIAAHSSYVGLIGSYSIFGFLVLILLFLLIIYRLTALYYLYGFSLIYYLSSILIIPVFNDIIQSPQYVLAFTIFIFCAVINNRIDNIRIINVSYNSR